MHFKKGWLAASAGLLIATGALAAPVDVGGVKMDDTADVRGSKLVLNGAGVRYKAVFKVYAATLPIKEPELFQAMLDTWLGKKPADWMLKDALLGKKG